MKKLLLIAAFGVLTVAAVISLYCNSLLPVPIIAPATHIDAPVMPLKNLEIIQFVEAHGEQLAPNYKDAVCTEFVIKVIEHFDPLTSADRRKVRIITKKELSDLVVFDSAVIKGVQTALRDSGKGTVIEKAADVRPGDFVQFWSIYLGRAYGHCGIITEVDSGKSVSMFSSHPMTSGFGEQKFSWPDKIYFVRLN
jgi:hypothetical protein